MNFSLQPDVCLGYIQDLLSVMSGIFRFLGQQEHKSTRSTLKACLEHRNAKQMNWKEQKVKINKYRIKKLRNGKLRVFGLEEKFLACLNKDFVLMKNHLVQWQTQGPKGAWANQSYSWDHFFFAYGKAQRDKHVSLRRCRSPGWRLGSLVPGSVSDLVLRRLDLVFFI